MASKYLICPWCSTQNEASKLAMRGGKCRVCRHDVKYGLDWLKQRDEKRRAAKTKKERAAVKKALQQTQEWRDMAKRRSASRMIRMAKAGLTKAWSMVTVGAAEQDVSTLKRQVSIIEKWTRRLDRATATLSASHPSAANSAPRAVVLPEEKE